MTTEEVKIALNEGIPFAAKMADGRQYIVTDPYQIALGSTRIVIIDEKGLGHVFPIHALTSINYLAAGPK